MLYFYIRYFRMSDELVGYTLKIFQKLLLVFLVTVSLTTIVVDPALATEKISITTNLLNDTQGIYNATIDIPCWRYIGVYTSCNVYNANILGANTNGFGWEAGLNCYFTELHQGFYVGGGFSFLNNNISASSNSMSSIGYNALGYCFQFGYRKIFEPGFILNAEYSSLNQFEIGLGYTF